MSKIKKKQILFIALLVVVASLIYKVRHDWKRSNELKQEAELLYVDFDFAMKKDLYENVFVKEPVCAQLYTSLRDLYSKYNLAQIVPHANPKIPKIIHQIWLGSPVPERFKNYQQTWKDHHPDWEYKLWTDENIHTVLLDNQDLFNAATNYGEKSDILKYELLYKFGGVYADFDYECLKPLDILNHSYDFYIGIQPMDTNLVQLGLGLFASIPGHPLLKKCITELRESKSPHIVARTGPLFFTRIFWHYPDDNTTLNVALPASYLYPMGYNQRGTPATVWQKPESFAVHHWAGSWLNQSSNVRS